MRRVTSPSTCSRRRACPNAITVELSLLGQRSNFTTSAASATAARLRLGAREVLLERAHLQEIHVAGRALGALHRVVIRRPRVVGDEVPWLHAELLEIERVAGRDLGLPLLPVEQANRLLGRAVDGVHELQIANPEIILGAGLDEYFFDR
ncbi:MAG: hypothetical protein LC753_04890 [Acidobacteria bacterium]|nr:hypothetical protein [Acidobacteriota bacterium]